MARIELTVVRSPGPAGVFYDLIVKAVYGRDAEHVNSLNLSCHDLKDVEIVAYINALKQEHELYWTHMTDKLWIQELHKKFNTGGE